MVLNDTVRHEFKIDHGRHRAPERMIASASAQGQPACVDRDRHRLRRSAPGRAGRVARGEHRFRFKAIASVIAKGMTTQTRVYELVEAIA
jgi:hypothetical protein